MYQATEFEGLVVFEPNVIHDERGYFTETYRESALNDAVGYPVKFVQENQSKSHKNVFRGLHFQHGDFAQGKLVRVICGSVIDIVLDMRKDQPTYGKTYTIVLTDKNMKQMFVPAGFAHGFLSTNDNTIFHYKCTNYYNKQSEGGINPLPYLPLIQKEYDLLDMAKILITEKDQSFPEFVY